MLLLDLNGEKVKELIKSHLRRSIEKLQNLTGVINQNEDLEFIREKFMDTVPQIYLHSSMLLKIFKQEEFESTCEFMMEITK